MGIDDLVNKGKAFLEDNKEKIGNALNSEQAEQVSDSVLDAGANFVKKLTADEHDSKVDEFRASADKAIGTE